MPPSGFSQKAVKGILQFTKTCYEDLLQEVADGKHASIEEAIKTELANLEKALLRLHIDNEGNLVERPPP